jgi:REP element-mobilizing transposase RayT
VSRDLDRVPAPGRPGWCQAPLPESAEFVTIVKRTLAGGSGVAYRGDMGRPHRIEVPDGYYHVHTRGNDRQDIYFGNWSGRLFVRELTRTSQRQGWRILAYCLMRNHYHLVLQIADCLSDGMRDLNSRFAQTSNWVNKRSDHLFGKRFTSHLIETESYLLESVRYVLLNPVRAGSVRDPRHWRFSSMRATVGLDLPPTCLDVASVLTPFGRQPSLAQKRFGQFVNAGLCPPWPVPGTDTGM